MSSPAKNFRRAFLEMAEEVGFEPTELSFNGFQDRRLKPLGHSSKLKFLLAFFDLVPTSKIRSKYLGDDNTAVFLLVVFKDRHQCPADCKS